MNRLSLAHLGELARGVARPGYDPASLQIGVVHFGPGAFHRAHQGVYFDDLAKRDPRWGICGVSLHSRGVQEALRPQDGLYSLAVLDETVSYRIIGSMREILVAPDDPQAVMARLSSTQVEIVTSTVTEKGYCLRGDGQLDLKHADIIHDVANPQSPISFIGYVVEGLRRRKAQGGTAFVLIPCDNLASNGQRLKAGVVTLARQNDTALARWIEDNLVCPCTMVDSITPATDEALRTQVAQATGLRDAWPIQREAFSQWVIEAHEHKNGPDWASIGVTITHALPDFERAKLRLLNATHSTLAYFGSLKGYESVSDAMKDAQLAQLVKDLMFEDIVPLLDAASHMDLPLYCASIIKRFQNPAIRHLLSQIACDGSQKLPIRILSSIGEALSRGRSIDRLCLPIAAWMRFVRVKALSGEAIIDPLADELLTLGHKMQDGPEDVDRFLDLRSVFSQDLVDNCTFRSGLKQAYLGVL